MPDLSKLKAANARRFAAMRIDVDRVAAIDVIAKRLVAPAAKARYRAVEARTAVPWWVVAVIHDREGGGRFDRYLGNGQPLDRVTTEVPKGRGPFSGADAFERGCVDSLICCPPYAARNRDWSAGGALTLLEQYNGLGYADMDMPSPYIWASTDQYSRGKYVADHDYDPDVVDHQIGCAALLQRMAGLDPSVAFERAAPTAVPAPARAAPVSPPSPSTKSAREKPAPELHVQPQPAPLAEGKKGIVEQIRDFIRRADFKVKL